MSMNREIYMNKIEEVLYIITHKVILRSSLNLLDLNVRLEDFYKQLFNLLFSYDLVNANVLTHNQTAFDLIDTDRKIIIQISSTASKRKIEDTLSKSIIGSEYAEYALYFMFIGDSASRLVGKKYNNPYNVIFDSKNNIYDVDTILKYINSLDILKLKEVYKLVNDSFNYNKSSVIRVKSLLPKVVQILCSKNLDQELNTVLDTRSYEIEEKIKLNKLIETKYIIDEYAPYEHLMTKIYNEFDRNGNNKSKALFHKIKKSL